MKRLDLWLQDARIRRVMPHLRPGDRILDVGCADGALFRATATLGPGESLGLDPELNGPGLAAGFELLPSPFPDGVPDGQMFDAIVMLAVLEHVPPEEQARWAGACARLLAPAGRLLITVPAPAVDRILDALMAVRLIDGMEVGQHYGFDPRAVTAIFTGPRLKEVVHRRFQLRLNHLFVFECAERDGQLPDRGAEAAQTLR